MSAFFETSTGVDISRGNEDTKRSVCRSKWKQIVLFQIQFNCYFFEIYFMYNRPTHKGPDSSCLCSSLSELLSVIISCVLPPPVFTNPWDRLRNPSLQSNRLIAASSWVSCYAEIAPSTNQTPSLQPNQRLPPSTRSWGPSRPSQSASSDCV